MQHTRNHPIDAVLFAVLSAAFLARAAEGASLSFRFVRPSYGSTSGGDRVVIRGDGFGAGLSVSFGAAPAAGVTIRDAREVSVITPPGSGDVAITLQLGPVRVVREGAFSYVRPDADDDGDGTTFAAEIAARTNPFAADTDGDGLSDAVETKTGIFVSSADTGTDPRSADTDGGRTGDGTEVARGTNPHEPSDDAVPVALPVVLYDQAGRLWDVDRNGQIWEGSSDAFDGAAALAIDGAPFPGLDQGNAAGDGREVLLGPVALGGVKLTRRIFVSPAFPFARYLEVVENPGAADISLTLEIATNLGSDRGTVVVATSSGDAQITAADRWFVTDDAKDGAGDPTIVHFVAFQGCSTAPARIEAANGIVAFAFDLVVRPGRTIAICHALSQQPDRAAASSFAAFIDGQPRLLAERLPHDLMLRAVNFTADSDGDGIPDSVEARAGLDPDDPADASGDADGDTLPNIAEEIAGTAIDRADSDGDGFRDDAELALGTDPLDPDSDGDGLAELDDPFPLFPVKLALTAPAAGIAGRPAELSLALSDAAGNRLPRPGAIRISLTASSGALVQGPGPGRILQGSGSASVVLETANSAASVNLSGAAGQTVTIAAAEVDQVGLAAGQLPSIRFLEATGDADGDGLSNADEIAKGTDPLRQDTDADGLSDGVETDSGVYRSPQDTGTDPLAADTDGDGAEDGFEVAVGTDPVVAASAPRPVDAGLVLQSDQLQIGLNLDGSLISDVPGVGMRFDPPGPADLTDDVLLPGIPFEAFGLAWVASDTGKRTLLFNGAPDRITGSAIPMRSYRIEGRDGWNIVASLGQAGPLALRQTLEMPRAPGAFRFRISIENRGAAAVRDVTYIRSVDFDDGNENPLSKNTISGTAVMAGLERAGAVFALGSFDGRAVVSAEGCGALDPRAILDSPRDPAGAIEDTCLHVAFRLGDLEPGGRADFLVVYAAGVTDSDALDAFTFLFDTDGDGVPDPIEIAVGLDPANPADGAGDLDGDGLSNAQEALFRSRLDLADTDGDRLADRQEFDRGTNPRLADTDGDAVGDADDPFPLFRLRVTIAAPSGGLAGSLAPVDVSLDGEGGEQIPPGAALHLKLRASAGAFAAAARAGAILAGGGTREIEARTAGGILSVDIGGQLGDVITIEAIDIVPLGFGEALPATVEFFAPVGDIDADGLSNVQEVAIGSSPRSPDSDRDGIADLAESLGFVTGGRWLPPTDPAFFDSDGGGIDDGLEIIHGLRAGRAGDDAALIPLPTDLPAGMTENPQGGTGTPPFRPRWDIQGDGSVRRGANTAYLGGLSLAVNGDPFPATERGRLLDRKELFFGPARLGGFSVSRHVYASADAAWACFVEIIDNPAAVARAVNLSITSRLGSGLDTRIYQTSDDARPLTAADSWIVTESRGGRTPSLLHVFRGEHCQAVVTPRLISSETLRIDYTVEVPARGRVTIGHLAAQAPALNSEWLAQMARSELAWLPGNAWFLPRDYLRVMRNFRLDTDQDGIPDESETPLGLNPNDPADAGLDGDGDGLSALVEHMLGTDPSRRDTDDDGLSDSDEFRRRADPLMNDTDADGTPDPDDPVPAFLVYPLLTAPRWARAGEMVTVSVRLESGSGHGIPEGIVPRFALRASSGAFAGQPAKGRVISGGGTGEILVEPDASEFSIAFSEQPGRVIELSIGDPAGVGLAALDPARIEFFAPEGDLDGDLVANGIELARGSSPRYADTDEDGLSDAAETATGIYAGPADTGTNPANADTDGDGVPDGIEVARLSNPDDPASVPPARTDPALLTGDRLLVGVGADARVFNAHEHIGVHFRPRGASDFGPEILNSESPWPDGFAVRSSEFTPYIRFWTYSPGTEQEPYYWLKPWTFRQYVDDEAKPTRVAWVGANGSLMLAQRIDLRAADPFFRCAIRLTNIGAETIHDLRYLRTFKLGWDNGDPYVSAVDRGLSISWTWNETVAFALGTEDPRGIAVAGTSFGSDPDYVLAEAGCPVKCPTYTSSHLIFRLGSLAPGASTELSFVFGAGCTIEEARSSFEASRDADRDGVPDAVERDLGLDPGDPADAAGDLDGDTLTNADEYRLGTRLDVIDTDGDGIADGVEVRYGFNPLLTNDAKSDVDGDGLADIDELIRGTNPTVADSDGDGIKDGVEVTSGLDPLSGADGAGDIDGDGLTNAQEAALGTSLVARDSDGDGVEDGEETAASLDPLDPDTDGDFLTDGEELRACGTDPRDADCDADRFADGLELGGGSDPLSDQSVTPGALREDFTAGPGSLRLMGTIAAGQGTLELAPAGSESSGGAFSKTATGTAAFYSEIDFLITAAMAGRPHGLGLVLMGGGPMLGDPQGGLGLGGIPAPALVIALELAPGDGHAIGDRLGSASFPSGIPHVAADAVLPLGNAVTLPVNLAASGRLRLTVEARSGWAEVSLARNDGGAGWTTPFRVALELPPLGMPCYAGLVATSGPGLGAVEIDSWLFHPLGAVEVASVEPAEGPAAGGTAVTIRGNGFVPQTKAFLDLAELDDQAVSAATELGGRTPPGAPGIADLFVTGPSGAARLGAAYAYGPAIVGVDPPSGSPAGGEPVRVYTSGVSATGSQGVFFGASAAEILARPLPNLIVVAAPPGALGSAVDVRLSAPEGEALARQAFSYARVLRVPEDHATVPEAVKAAIDRSIIEIAPGMHSPEIVIDGKRLELRGRAGARLTRLVSVGHEPVLKLENGARATVRGLTLTGSGGGIRVEPRSHLDLVRSRVTENRSFSSAAGIEIADGGTARIVASIIDGNESQDRSGALNSCARSPGAVSILSSTIAFNKGFKAGGVTNEYPQALEIAGTLFWENRATGGSGTPLADFDRWSGAVDPWLGVRDSFLVPGPAGASHNRSSVGALEPIDRETFVPLAGRAAIDAGFPTGAEAGFCADFDGFPRIRDGDGDGRPLSDTGALEAAPRPAVSIGADATSGEAPRRIAFTAAVDGTYDDVFWDFGDGSPIVSGVLATAHDYAVWGAYTATVTVTFLDFADSDEVRIDLRGGAMHFIRGDVSGDGLLQINDPIALLSLLFAHGHVMCLAACDANADASVNIADVIRLLGYLFAHQSVPEPNSCGEDPAPNRLSCERSFCTP